MVQRDMEEKIEIRRARIPLDTYLTISILFGISFAILLVALNIAIVLFRLAMGDPEVGLGDFLWPFLAVVTVPIYAAITGVLSYPVYRYSVNRWFSMRLKIFGERDHS